MVAVQNQPSASKSSASSGITNTLKSKFMSFLKGHIDIGKIRRSIYFPLWQKLWLKAVTRADMAANLEAYGAQEFGNSHVIHASPPIVDSVDGVPDIAATLTGSFGMKRPFVAEISDVYLVGPAAVGVTQDGAVLMESVMPDGDDRQPGFEALPLRTLTAYHPLAKLQATEMESVCSLVNTWGCKIYFHWFTECLAKLEGLEWYQQQTGIKPTLLLHKKLKGWQRESLELLGYKPEDYVEWTGKPIKAKTLVLPSFRQQCRWSDPEVYRWMRDRMLSNLPPLQEAAIPYSPRIFISRRLGAGRGILNEDAVMQVLEPLGFKSYIMEDLSFADEVRLFSQAEVIVGTHGSGLVNMIFSTGKTRILDLYGEFYTGGFFQLSHSMGFPYACLHCDRQGLDPKGADLVVDIPKLKRVLHKLLQA
jgi:capsular polysaccharide biosynthesis protein